MTVTELKTTKSKAYVGGVVISIGMLQTHGDLHTLKVSNSEEKFTSICPEDRTPLRMRYVCENDAAHGPYDIADVLRSTADGTVIDKDKLDAARESVLPAKQLNLQVHRRADMEAHTSRSGNVYVFAPNANTSKLLSALIDLIKSRPDLALVAKTNLRKRDHLVMLDVVNDQLVITELVWPHDMKAFAPVARSYEAKDFAMVEQIMDAVVEDFDPEQYRKESRERITEMVAQESGAAPAFVGSKGKGKAKAEPDNFTAALEAQLAALKNKKGRKAS